MSRSALLVMFAMGFAWATLIAGVVRAGSIFDDDYVPPHRPEQPKTSILPAPANPPEPTPTPANPTPTIPTPSVTPASPTVPSVNPVRRSVPGKSDQARCRKLFKEVFADQLKDKSASARRKLSQSLLKEAAKATDTPADCFVLLTGALDAARESGSLRLCFQAADELAKLYGIDQLAAEADAAEKVWTASTASTATVANVQAAFDVVDQLVAEDDFFSAGRVELALQHGIGNIRDAELKAAAGNHVRDFDAMRVERDKLGPILEKLKSSPDDPAANFAVGSYLCFTCGQWEKGLPFLDRGNDPAVKTLAATEVRKSDDLETIEKLADGWWDLAIKLTGTGRTRTQMHAAALYRRVVANVPGLRQLAIEKRIAGAPSDDSRRRIDLLDIVDPAIDTGNGRWRVEDGMLVCEPGEYSRIEFRYAPPEEYDYRVSFTVMAGTEAMTQIACGSGHQFAWVNGGWGNTISGFDMIGGVGAKDNQAGKRSKRWLVNGQRYTSVLKVRKTGAEAFLNGQLVSSWKTDYSDMTLYGGYALHHHNTVGVGAYARAIKFDLAEVIEVTGRGKTLIGQDDGSSK